MWLRLSTVVAVLSFATAVPFRLKMVGLQAKHSENALIGQDYTGRAHLIAKEHAEAKGLSTYLDVR